MGELADRFIGNRICLNRVEIISMWGIVDAGVRTMVFVAAVNTVRH
jgi:hypothetical protein